MWVRRVLRHLSAILVTILVGGLLGASLVRFAPGFGTDERELDSRFAEESIEALRGARVAEGNLLAFYGGYLLGLLQGDLGVSTALGRPVRELLAERVPVTFRSVGAGLLLGWLAGVSLAVPWAMKRASAYDLFSTAVSGLFLSTPSAVLALLFLFADGPVYLAIGLAVFPRVFRYARNLLIESYGLPHVLTARAKGLSGTRILLSHVFPVAGPQILALAGVTVSLAFGAAIPIEVICDSPGVGQLAWQAALGRDLPLLVNLTVLVTAVTVVANSCADLAIAAWEPAGG